MKDIELYKLLVTEDNKHETALADELGWVSDDTFLVWVSYLWLKEFIQSLKEMFGEGLFDDGSFDGNFQSDSVCFDLEEILSGCDIDLSVVFPPSKYEH